MVGKFHSCEEEEHLLIDTVVYPQKAVRKKKRAKKLRGKRLLADSKEMTGKI